jgi:ACS family sodium-dependent inorganic phosphate cotransporter
LGEGTTFPALSALLATWVPLKERSKLGSFVFGGGQIGTILGTALSGYLISKFDSWESVFYFFGILGVLWFVVFVLICYKDPESHPFIKDSEKEYLQREMGTLKRDKSLPPTPWLAIITSVPMLALICAQIGHDFGFFIMATDLPKYMSDVLRFPIKQNGLYSSLPYLAMWLVSIGLGFVSDWMISNKYINITNSRKLWTTVGELKWNFDDFELKLMKEFCSFRWSSYLHCRRLLRWL